MKIECMEAEICYESSTAYWEPTDVLTSQHVNFNKRFNDHFNQRFMKLGLIIKTPFYNDVKNAKLM